MGKEKKEKLRQKLKLMMKCANVLIEDKERLEKQLKAPQKKIKKDPSQYSPAQRAVHTRFSERAKIASALYNEEGSVLSWADAMSAAGPLLEFKYGKKVKHTPVKEDKEELKDESKKLLGVYFPNESDRPLDYQILE